MPLVRHIVVYYLIAILFLSSSISQAKEFVSFRAEASPVERNISFLNEGKELRDLMLSITTSYLTPKGEREASSKESPVEGTLSIDKRVQDWGLSLLYSEANRSSTSDHSFGILVNRVFQ